MENRSVVVDTSVFSDCFSPDVPKISAVYKRREKKKDDDENQKPAQQQQQQQQQQEAAVASSAAFTAAGRADVFVYTDEEYENKDRCVPKKLGPRSWNNRSLSFRGRRSSILSSDRLPLSVISSNQDGDSKAQDEGNSTDSSASVSCNPPTYELKGNLQGQSHSRRLPHIKPQRPWVGVSLAFVKEQQAFFADIDAFNLDEKEVYFGPSPQEPAEDSLEPQAAQDEPCNFHCHKKPLEAVPEEGLTKITSQMLDDLLTAALVTPQPPSYLQTSCKNVPVQMSPSAITPGFPASRTLLRTSFGFPKLSLFSKVLESEQAIPSPETLRDETSRSSLPCACSRLSFSANCRASDEGLFFDSQSLISGLESLQIREEDDQVDYSKIDLCTPILKEDNNWLGAISEEEFPEGKEANDDDKEADGYTVETEFLSVFDTLLRECGQGQVQSLKEAISNFCDLKDIVKLGEGTYGEAFKGGGNVFKIVPMDGDFQVNGETQKTSAEILSEVLLHNVLNKLRGDPTSFNMCTNFIHTKATRICQGTYDSDLVRAWEDWDATRTSENDHPMLFPNKQLYVVFVLADGGGDLESFVLADFDEARSVLFQVVLALAVAEEAFQFEHRDLHWGNIVLVRCNDYAVPYRLLGQSKLVKSFGISLSLIDFTLSRLDTGKQVLFINLSADPALFEGRKGDIQADTYRRMLKLTKAQWEGRFLKTNCLWIHYLADILLSKKAFSCSEQEKRSLRAFRKRVLLYECAGAAMQDDFFDGMLDSLE